MQTFKVGNMVAIVREPNNVGFIVDVESFKKELCSYVHFVSGENAGRKLLFDNTNLISVDDVVNDDDSIEEPQIQKEEAPIIKTEVSKPTKKKWTKTEVVAMIKEKPGAIERGILCLNKHNSHIPEKSRSFVAYWASYINGGKQLSGKHLFNARRTCFFNAKVLVDAANGVL